MKIGLVPKWRSRPRGVTRVRERWRDAANVVAARYAFTRAFTGHVFDHWRGCSRSTVDGGRAQLRPVGVGAPARRRWPNALASPRATRIRRPQPRRLGAGQ